MPRSRRNCSLFCAVCLSRHSVASCPEFRRMTRTERVKVVSLHSLCVNCLSDLHNQADCKTFRRCVYCQRAHHSLLHHRLNVPRTNPSVDTVPIPRSNHASNINVTPIRQCRGSDSALPNEGGRSRSPRSSECDVISLHGSESGLSLHPELSWAEQMEEHERENSRSHQAPPRPVPRVQSVVSFRPLLQHERRAPKPQPERRVPRTHHSRRRSRRGRHLNAHPVCELQLHSHGNDGNRQRNSSNRSAQDLRGRIQGTTAPLILMQMVAVTPTARMTILKQNRNHSARALINTGYARTLICPELVARLNLPYERVGGERTCFLTLRSDTDQTLINICAMIQSFAPQLSPARSLDPKVLDPFRHLALADNDCWKSSKVHVLLGADVFTRILKAGASPIIHGQLTAQSTIFGWTLSGACAL